MSFPNWAPDEAAKWLELYKVETVRLGNSIPPCDGVPNLYDMWLRLLTRPEMELIWHFIGARHGNLRLLANGGLVGTLNREVVGYIRARKVSPTHYKEEMDEISALAATLARKINNYSSSPATAFSYYNPFHFDYLLDRNDLARAESILASENVGEYELTDGRISGAILREHLPSIEKILDRLSKLAKSEAKSQNHRLRLPKKVNGASTFRTYFIKQVSDYFLVSLTDFSPTRIATFCSVALDDSSITPDLVRKIFPLDDQTRSMLKSSAEYWKEYNAYRNDPED